MEIRERFEGNHMATHTNGAALNVLLHLCRCVGHADLGGRAKKVTEEVHGGLDLYSQKDTIEKGQRRGNRAVANVREETGLCGRFESVVVQASVGLENDCDNNCDVG